MPLAISNSASSERKNSIAWVIIGDGPLSFADPGLGLSVDLRAEPYKQRDLAKQSQNSSEVAFETGEIMGAAGCRWQPEPLIFTKKYGWVDRCERSVYLAEA